ncbi:hydrogenase maturation protein HypF [Roseospirillum parvum]|uniref:Hydrogenase maturation protein HypF n=1 Tax=Roseospirillum parvum TaxID=83401 RepID=A0A1G8B1H3_9PROT|nr:hydrogenase maturation protein HypF [Roseospirillum parvum]SDH27109.1 hydrogenase maturation protein HypF [Roseospirillum parvum]
MPARSAVAIDTAWAGALPFPVPPVLALGAHLKAAAAWVADGRGCLGPTVGDLDHPQARDALAAQAEALADTLPGAPRAVAHDLHPDFASTRLAQGLAAAWGVPARPVQHHRAHLAALAVEHGHAGPLLGLVLDGFGLGDDGQPWGGELLALDGATCRRLGHLRPLPQPGGDAAARQPWRMGAAALHVLGRGGEIAPRYADQPQAAALAGLLARGTHCPETPSGGRLFDAACGLLGVHPVAEFEGQAPMALERLVRQPRVWDGGWRLDAAGRLDLLSLLDRLADTGDAVLGAELFHGTLAAALVAWAAWAAETVGTRAVGLSGGCFFNRVLGDRVASGLAGKGLAVLRHRALSPGDDSLALGQAWVVAQTLAE